MYYSVHIDSPGPNKFDISNESAVLHSVKTQFVFTSFDNITSD